MSIKASELNLLGKEKEEKKKKEKNKGKKGKKKFFRPFSITVPTNSLPSLSIRGSLYICLVL